MRLKLISCEIFYREICYAVSRSINQVDVEFFPKGLHDIGAEKMRGRLQDALQNVDGAYYDAVLLGYALCNNGVAGLQSNGIPLIIPRAHDCITLFLGSKERYLEIFNQNSGVYYETSGWLERGEELSRDLQPISIQNQLGLNMTYQELVEKYGEDNARYLYEQLGDLTRHYTKCTYIEMGVEPDGRFEQSARKKAGERGWEFEKISGDMGLIQRLVDGPWNGEEFLVVPPGHRAAASYDASILTVEKIQS
ncbi:MAG: DUF1638 domain-containing protein [Candidatus Omnitrophica bacterium]|nr:DUF1638 domain-containing protein [Candidatus Omnitrophota bacterium]